MAMRHSNPEPLASRAPAVAARHVGGGPGLIGEHEALAEDRVAPRTSPCGVSGCRGGPAPQHGLSFFARDAVTREQSLNGPEAKEEALPGQRMTHLLDGGVLGGTECRQNGSVVCFDGPSAAVTAQGLGARFAFLPFPLPPPADASPG